MRSARLLLLLAFAFAAALAASAVGPPPAARDDAPDPVPIRRAVLPADRLAAELKRVEAGVLAQMPRGEFDRLVKQAGRAVADRRAPPRLVEAKYRARLSDDALAGTATWKVLHDGRGPALLRLRPDNGSLGLALRQPRVAGRDAVLADFAGADKDDAPRPALLIDGPGEHAVTAEWSARAEARPEGLRIDLRLAPAPVAELELDLPAGATPVVPDGAVAFVARPEAGGRRLWRVACGGRAHLPLVIRRAGAATAIMTAWQRAVQRLGPDGLEVTATFDIQSPGRDLSELVLELGPGVRPVAVTATGRERWEQRGASEVVVRLAEPARELTLEVRGLAPLGPADGRPGPVAWGSPAVRLRGAVPRGESLELWLHPELRVSAFSPGDFVLRDSAARVDEQKVRWQRLVLEGGGVSGAPAGGAPRRPAATVQIGGVAARVKQLTWWQVGGDGMALTTRLEYEVRQGLLFELAARVPAGWEVESVEMAPEAALRSWGVRADKGGLLLADLRQPLRPGAAGALTARLRWAGAGAMTGRDLPFPDVRPAGVRLREGGLAIEYDERAFQAAAGGAASGELPPEGPWGQTIPDFYYPFQGEPPAGALRLSARPPLYSGRAQQDVFVRGGRALVQTRLVVEAEGGRPTSVDVVLSEPGDAPWDWRAEARPGGPAGRVARAERRHAAEVSAGLAALAAGGPLGVALYTAARPAGAWWRLHFDRPLPIRQPVALLAGRELPADGPADQPRWAVPLVALPGATALRGEVALHLVGAEPVAIDHAGLAEAAARPRGPGATARSFRYHGAAARLAVTARPLAPGRPAEVAIDRARLTTRLTGAGRLVHHFRFRAQRWPGRALPVRLPAGAELLAVGIDGRWVRGLEADGEGAVAVPVPRTADGEGPTLQIVYVTEASAGRLGARLEAPVPALPVELLGIERRWLLPPELVPLTGRARRVPGTGEGHFWRAPRRALELFGLGPSLLLPGRSPDRRPDRQQALTDALAGLRNDRPGAALPLGAVVEELVSGYLRDLHPLVIDTAALEQAGVTASSPVTLGAPADDEGLWATVGLAAAAAGPGLLLTTRDQLRRWPDGEPPADVRLAMARAAAAGRDGSGRFALALEWLAAGGPAGAGPELLRPDDHGSWGVWAPAAGADGASLVVVRRELGTVVGLSLALALLLAVILGRAWVARRWPRVLLVWVGAAGLALPWLPDAIGEVALWPLLLGLGACAVTFLWWANRPFVRAAPATAIANKSALRPSSNLSAGAGAVLLLGLGGLAAAALAEPETVYLVGGDDGTVLLTPKLARQLRELSQPPFAPPAGAVLVSAQYDGAIVEGQAEFEATFAAHCTGDGPHALAIPLDGVELTGDVLVDGARAYPQALGPPRGGYSVKLRGAGAHKVVMRFRAVVANTPDDPRAAAGPGQRLVRFTAPRLATGRLTFRAPPGGQHLHAPARLGRQVVMADKDALKLDAELGPVAGPVQVRWYQRGAAAKPARVEAREAHLWDLRPDASLLTTLVRFDISGGVVTELGLDVPAELEVRSAQARRPAGSAEGAVRLSGWAVDGAGAKRAVRLSFAAPVSGAVEATLELMPRAPWSGEVPLPLPRAHGRPAAEPSYLAYRTSGVEAGRLKSLALTGLKPEEFAPFWPEATRPGALAYQSSFRRDAPQAPELRLHVRPAAPRLTAKQAVTLRVGPRQAELAARLELTAAGKDLSLVEWDISSPRPVLVGAVTGPDVYRWAQSGARLLVWLKHTTGATTVEMAGWVPVVGEGKGPPTLEVPALRPVGVEAPLTRLALVPAPGLKLSRPALRGLEAEAGGLTFVARAASYGGRFAVEAGPPPAASVRTEAAAQGQALIVTSTIDYVLQGEIRAVTVRLRDWEGEAVLEAPAGAVARRREQAARAGGRRERTWVLELAPGVKDRLRLTLRGKAPLGEALLPDVSVSGAAAARVVAVGAGLSAEPGGGLAAVAGEARAWRVVADEWSLRVVPAEAVRPATVEALLTEVRASVADGRSWAYEAAYWLWHEAPAEVAVRWAGEVEVLGATIDGEPQPVMRPGQGRLYLPLTGQPGARRVVLRYRLPAGVGGLSRPGLLTPRLEGAAEGPVLWTVELPPGWELVSAAGARPLGAGATRRAAVELRRAAVQRALARRARAGGGDTAALESRAGRALALAALALRSGGDGERPLGPEGVSLSLWLARLREEGGAAGVMSEAARRAEGEGGGAVSWVGQPEDALRVRLAPVSQQEARQALAASAEWLVVWLAVAAVAVSSFLRGVAKWLWPELALLLGLLGWHLAGPRVAVVFLLALGAFGRLLLLVHWAQGRFRRAA